MAHGVRGIAVTGGDVKLPQSPFCVLMVGLPGSGKKTTLARALTDRGYERISPDEEMFRRHGVYGVDFFPRGIFPTLEKPVLEETRVVLADLLRSGKKTWL